MRLAFSFRNLITLILALGAFCLPCIGHTGDLYSDLGRYYGTQTPPDLKYIDCATPEGGPDARLTFYNDAACDHLKYKMSIVYNLMYQSIDTEPTFYEVHESPPKLCMSAKKQSPATRAAHWSCVYSGIKDAMKYELLNLATAKCTPESTLDEVASIWNSAANQCKNHKLSAFFPCLAAHTGLKPAHSVQRSLDELARLSQEFELLKEACKKSILKPNNCRLDEYVKFQETVTSFDWLRSNADLLSTWEPGFEPLNVPDYFYLLNSCEPKRKHAKTFVRPDILKPERCESSDSKACSEQVTKTASDALKVAAFAAESIEPPKPTKQQIIRKAIQNELNARKEKPGRKHSEKKAIERLSKDEKYLKKLEDHYAESTEDEIHKNLGAAVEKLFLEKKPEQSEPLSLDKQNKLPSSEVKMAETTADKKDSAPPLTPKTPEHVEKTETQKQREKELFAAIQVQLPNEEMPKPSSTDSAGDALLVPRSSEEVEADAKRALQDYKDHKASAFDFSRFFLDEELLEEKESARRTISPSLRSSWRKQQKKYQDVVAKAKGNTEEKLHELVTQLNGDFLKNYSRDYARFTDFLKGLGGNCEAETKMIMAAIQSGQLPALSDGQRYAAQVFSDHIQLVLYDQKRNKVTNLLTFEEQKGVVAPLYDPLILVQSWIEKKGNDSPLQAKDLLIADVNRRDPKNKGESSGALTNTNLKLPLSNVSFGHGRPIPKVATINAPLPIGTKASDDNANPMRGADAEVRHDRKGGYFWEARLMTEDEKKASENTERHDVIGDCYLLPKGTFQCRLTFRDLSDLLHHESLKIDLEAVQFINFLQFTSLYRYAMTQEFTDMVRAYRDPQWLFSLPAAKRLEILKRGRSSTKLIEETFTGYNNFGITVGVEETAPKLIKEVQDFRLIQDEVGKKILAKPENLAISGIAHSDFVEMEPFHRCDCLVS